MKTLPKKTLHSNPRKQEGFAMLGMLAAITIAGVVLVGYMQYQNYIKRSEAAHAIGNSMAQYIAATEQRMAEDTTLVAGNYSDTTWLKLASCGGSAPKAYLPCGFTTTNSYLRAPFTVVLVKPSGDKPTATITVQAPQIFRNGTYTASPVMAGEAIQAAKARIGTGSGYAGISSYSLNKTTGIITITASVNGGNDTWLRIDGGNKMEANITYDNTKSEAQRQLVNVSLIQMNANDAQINANKNLFVQSNNDMTIHSQQSITSSANIDNIINSGRNINLNANVDANIRGNQNTNLSSGQNINSNAGVDNNISANRNININSGGQTALTAPNSNVIASNAHVSLNSNTANLNITRDVSSWAVDDNNMTAVRNVNIYAANGQAAITGAGSNIIINANGDYINTYTGKPVYLGNQTGTPRDSNVTVNDMQILSEGGQYLSELLKFKLAQKMNDCYTTPNTGGRDFSKKMCHPGDYVAGIKFDGHDSGHGGDESVYLAVCCPTS